MKHIRTRTGLVIGSLLATLLFSSRGFAEQPVINLFGAWHNKYVTEGRDNLSRGGLVTVQGSATWDRTSAGLWLAEGDRSSYDELNAWVRYGITSGHFNATAAYTRLEFPDDDQHDNEISAGLNFKGLPRVTPAINYTYSTQANGAFVELSLRSEWKLLENRLSVQPYVLEGIDYGFATKDYDGLNHVQLGVDISFALRGKLKLFGTLAHSWAQEDIDRQDLGDESWLSIGVSTSL